MVLLKEIKIYKWVTKMAGKAVYFNGRCFQFALRQKVERRLTKHTYKNWKAFSSISLNQISQGLQKQWKLNSNKKKLFYCKIR